MPGIPIKRGGPAYWSFGVLPEEMQGTTIQFEVTDRGGHVVYARRDHIVGQDDPAETGIDVNPRYQRVGTDLGTISLSSGAVQVHLLVFDTHPANVRREYRVLGVVK